MGHSSVSLEEYSEASLVAARELMWLPSKAGYVRAASATLENKLEAAKVGGGVDGLESMLPQLVG